MKPVTQPEFNMNSTPSFASPRTRMASVALSVALTLAMLTSISTLARVEAGAAQMAQAASAQA